MSEYGEPWHLSKDGRLAASDGLPAFEKAQRTGQKVYVHCDAWLAHRPEGWEVRQVAAHGYLDIVTDSRHWATVPTADCTLVPRPFKVGDWVQTLWEQVGLVFAVDDDWIAVGFTNGGSAKLPSDRLTHITPSEALNA